MNERGGFCEEKYGIFGMSTIVTVKWRGNIVVHLAGTFMGAQPISNFKWWDFEENIEMYVDIDAIIELI